MADKKKNLHLTKVKIVHIHFFHLLPCVLYIFNCVRSFHGLKASLVIEETS